MNIFVLLTFIILLTFIREIKLWHNCCGDLNFDYIAAYSTEVRQIYAETELYKFEIISKLKHEG